MTDQPASNPPAGWYRNSENHDLQRWWDGSSWTDFLRPFLAPHQEHAASPQSAPQEPAPAPAWLTYDTPIPSTAVKSAKPSKPRQAPAGVTKSSGNTSGHSKRRFYWLNLTRGKFWWLTFGPSVVLSGLVSLALPPVGVVLFFILVVVVGWIWLQTQMVSRACAAPLPVEKADSFTVCRKCRQPTDAALKAAGKIL